VSVRLARRRAQGEPDGRPKETEGPPKESKHAEVRYLDTREDDERDDDQLRSWIVQASRLPGEKM
jgi:hypothetical protein